MLDYAKVRASGIAILLGLSLTWSVVVGLVVCTASGDWALFGGFALMGPLTALVMQTFLRRLFVLLGEMPLGWTLVLPVVLLYWTLVKPAEAIGLYNGWLVRME